MSSLERSNDATGRPRVLLFATRFHGYERAIADALINLGAQVELIDYLPHRFSRRPLDRLVGSVLPRLGMPVFNDAQRHRFRAKLLARITALEPDLCLVVKGEVLDPDTLHAARARSPATRWVCWFMDMIEGYPEVRALVPLFDRFYSYSTCDAQTLRSSFANVEYLPGGFDPTVYRPRPAAAKDIDVVFAGRVDAHRRSLLEPVVDRLAADGRSWRIIGGAQPGIGLLKHIKTYPRFLLKHVVHRDLDGRSLAHLYGRSRICLNIHSLGDAGSGAGRVGHNARFFEIGGAGGLQLVDRVAGTTALCEPGRHLVEYRDLDELLQHIQHLLRHPRPSERLAAAGQQWFAAHHTFQHRMAILLRAALAPSLA
jgi:spore maturation protein CgeB